MVFRVSGGGSFPGSQKGWLLVLLVGFFGGFRVLGCFWVLGFFGVLGLLGFLGFRVFRALRAPGRWFLGLLVSFFGWF